MTIACFCSDKDIDSSFENISTGRGWIVARLLSLRKARALKIWPLQAGASLKLGLQAWAFKAEPCQTVSTFFVELACH